MFICRSISSQSCCCLGNWIPVFIGVSESKNVSILRLKEKKNFKFLLTIVCQRMTHRNKVSRTIKEVRLMDSLNKPSAAVPNMNIPFFIRWPKTQLIRNRYHTDTHTHNIGFWWEDNKNLLSFWWDLILSLFYCWFWDELWNGVVNSLMDLKKNDIFIKS